MVHKVQGSITVFLSLILVMVLALVGTLLDVARVDMAGSYAYRALVSAVDTEFTKYCDELYEDYHIYMLGNGHSLENINGEDFVTSVSEYLMYSFDPDSNQNVLDSSIEVSGVDLLDLSMNQCSLAETTTIADYDAEVFEDQVAQYMKYYVAGDVADTLLAKLNLITQSGKTMTVVRKKNEVDEAVAKIDKSIMKLMQEVEGITFKNNTLVVKDNYSLKVQSSFAKKYCVGKASPESVSINKNVVWDSLKGHYIDPVAELSEMKGYLDTYTTNKGTIATLESEITQLEQQLEEAEQKPTESPVQTSEPTASAVPEETSEPEATADPEEIKDQIQDQIEEKTKEKETLEEENQNMLYEVKNQAYDIAARANTIKQNDINAISYINEISEERDSSLSVLSSFDSYLSENKDTIDADTYKGLEEEYEQTKDYVQQLEEDGSDHSVVGNIVAMKETLSQNEVILENTTNIMNQLCYVSEDTLAEQKALLEQLIDQYKSGYSIKTLKFDYSTLTIEENVKSPLDSFRSLMSNGLIEMVVDDVDALSKETINSSDLISVAKEQEAADVNADEENNSELAGKLKEQEDDEGSGISENLKSYETQCESASVEDSTVDQIARKVLVNEYGVSNFISVIDDINQKKNEQEKETKLKYEQEYLVIGGYNDLDNVKSIIMRTIFMRTAVNYISLLTNSKCRAEAKEVATLLVGFTGFTPLILITQQLILIAWGFEESLVDTRALLDGNKVPVIKKADDFCVKFTDLLTISKETIKKKADSYKDSDSLIAMSYSDYLRVYMLMVPIDTLSYRMMDLIQENMRLRYDSQFNMLNGIFGSKVTVSVTVPGKFLNIPFIKQFAGYDGSSRTIEVSAEYSY